MVLLRPKQLFLMTHCFSWWSFPFVFQALKHGIPITNYKITMKLIKRYILKSPVTLIHVHFLNCIFHNFRLQYFMGTSCFNARNTKRKFYQVEQRVVRKICVGCNETIFCPRFYPVLVQCCWHGSCWLSLYTVDLLTWNWNIMGSYKMMTKNSKWLSEAILSYRNVCLWLLPFTK